MVWSSAASRRSPRRISSSDAPNIQLSSSSRSRYSSTSVGAATAARAHTSSEMEQAANRAACLKPAGRPSRSYGVGHGFCCGRAIGSGRQGSPALRHTGGPTISFSAGGQLRPMVERNEPYRAAPHPWSRPLPPDWIEARTLPILYRRQPLQRLYVLSRRCPEDDRPAIDSLRRRGDRFEREKSCRTIPALPFPEPYLRSSGSPPGFSVSGVIWRTPGWHKF